VSVALRIAARELARRPAGFRIFLACLALGVAAIAAVGSVREAIQEGLSREGAAILGGDAEMSFTYRFAVRCPSAHIWMPLPKSYRKPSISAPWSSWTPRENPNAR
jgi:putative ABC transport system permease protein